MVGSRAYVLRLGAVAVVVAGLLLVAGAASSSSASSSSTLIEYWDGTGWAQQAGPDLKGPAGAVAAVSPTDAWAFAASGNPRLAAHWDGSSWREVTIPTPSLGGYINGAAAISGTDVWAVGGEYPTYGVERNLAEHWDGSTWSTVPSPTAGTRDSLAAVAAVSSRNVWAVGWYTPDGVRGGVRTLVLHWNGKAWKRVASPHPGSGRQSRLTAVTVVSPRSVWAVGNYVRRAMHAGADYCDFHTCRYQLILHWNGKQWSQVHTNGRADRKIRGLSDVAAVGRNNVWAVGASRASGFDSVDSPGHLALLEHWNGHSWQTVAASGGCASYWQTLTDLVVLAANDIWAVGKSSSPCQAGEKGATYTQALAEHWDGHSWSISPSLSPGGSENVFFDIDAATPHAVWAVGWYYG